MVLALIFIVIFLVSIVISTFLLMPLQVGCRRFFIECRSGSPIVDMVIFAFREGKDTYFNVVKVTFLMNMKIALWALLFIVPGIIKAYEYFMVPYLLADDPNMDSDTAFETSRRMMDGNKMNTFVLGLSFIGWNILSLFTLGLLSIFYVNPYTNLTFAELYHTLRAEDDFANANYIQDTVL